MKNNVLVRFYPKTAILFFAICGSASATPMTLIGCSGIADNKLRLECYDQLATQNPGNTAKTDNEKSSVMPSSSNPPVPVATARSEPAEIGLAQHWELGSENKRGVFNFRPHRQNYLLLANYSDSPNAAPYRQSGNSALGTQGLSHSEVAFQLGFKMKLAEDVLSNNTDIWFGYTQQSYWQAYNRRASSPFRETDYQPEIMAVMPVDFSLGGVNVRFINAGLVHQSNGQATSLSRSWNRIYLQTGLEKGNFSLSARIWKRLNEDRADDDNPDIVDYMGNGDVTALYRIDGHELLLLARHNFRTSRGATQIGWAFPLTTHLKGYVQAFSGYGQSLIDYNYSQKTLGMGFLISY